MKVKMSERFVELLQFIESGKKNGINLKMYAVPCYNMEYTLISMELILAQEIPNIEPIVPMKFIPERPMRFYNELEDEVLAKRYPDYDPEDEEHYYERKLKGAEKEKILEKCVMKSYEDTAKQICEAIVYNIEKGLIENSNGREDVGFFYVTDTNNDNLITCSYK